MHLLLECLVFSSHIYISLDLFLFSEVAEVHIRISTHSSFVLGASLGFIMLGCILLLLNGLSLIQVGAPSLGNFSWR